MNAIVQNKLTRLKETCVRFHVSRLELFGSATTDENFDSTSSDLDFLVEFEPCPPNEHYERYFGLLESLQEMFPRRIDLVEARAIQNPYFLRSVNKAKITLYAA